MNSAWTAQSTTSSENKRKYREINHSTLRKLRSDRLTIKARGETRSDMEERVRNRLNSSPEAADFMISLFASALFSYRRVSVCEPFPDAFMNEKEEKNFEEVEQYTNALPDVQHFIKKNYAVANLPHPALRLLDWIINTDFYEEFSVEKISLDQYKLETAGIDTKQSKVSDPSYIFKINYNEDHPNYKPFVKAKEEYGSKIGFHGSEFSNFYSIVHNGLDASFGKETSLYGEGIYLSEDRDVAYSFLKCGKNNYSSSMFGSQAGCLVCAEVVKHPKRVRFSSERTSTPISVTEDETKLPKGYIVVEDNVYVLVRYILVYRDFHGSGGTRTNVCQIIALVYIFFLVAIAFSRSNTFKQLYSEGFTY